ncbi:MAG TPA: BMP family ABC transporter substrate-binding protein [Bacillales bacterium]|nr:BMP family ABC transporter substrate-binding protein [Bacillales bacterium]
MRIKKLAISLVFVLIVSTLLSACGSSGGSSSNGGGATNGGSSDKAKNFKVGMVTDTGGVNDKSFNQGAWEGLQKFAKDHNMETGNGKQVTFLESQQSTDYETNLNQLVHHGYDLVFGIGYKMANAVGTIASQNPNAKLAIIDSVVTKKNGDLVPNVASITFKEQEGSFLVGVAAGIMTKTNKIGFVGGVKSDVISRFENGFKAGVKTVNPDAQIYVQYAGSFADAAKGGQIAKTMYGKGADIVFTAAGATGNGVFTEAKNETKNGHKVWVIGVDRDQYDLGLPENVTLTSMVKHVDKAVYKVSEETMKGNFPGGQHVVLGLKENGVGIADHTKNLSDKALSAIKKYKQQIIDGKIKAPGTAKEYQQYLSNLGQ